MEQRRKLGRSLEDISTTAISSLGKQAIPETQQLSQDNVRYARVICVTSGKGGTGKSVITSNLSVYFASRGIKTTMIDADFGMANLHIMFGIAPRHNISHVVDEKKRIEDITEDGPAGLKLVPGGSGISGLANLNDYQLDLLTEQLDIVEKEADVIFIDTSAGISQQTMVFLYAAREIMVVTTPDITAITDAYGIIKAANMHNPHALIGLIVNMVTDFRQGIAVLEKIRNVSSRFLGKDIIDYGCVPRDNAIPVSIARKSPVILSNPTAKITQHIGKIAHQLASMGTQSRVSISHPAGVQTRQLSRTGFFKRLRSQLNFDQRPGP